MQITEDKMGVKTLLALAKYYAPDTIKQACLQEQPSWQGLPPICYADYKGQYPIHTPIAAIASTALYLSNKDTDPDIAKRIKQACAYHGTPDTWEGMEKLAKEVDRAPEPTRFALGNRYPIETAEQVKQAFDYFEKYRDTFTKDEQQTYTYSLLSADSELHALPKEQHVQLEKYAGLGRPSRPLDDIFTPRKQAAMLAKRTDVLNALTIVERHAKQGTDYVKAASVLTALDKTLNATFTCEPETLYALTPSVAKEAQMRYAQAQNGDWYLKADLNKVPATAITVKLGTAPVLPVEKRAELLQTHGIQMQQLLAEYGVHPIKTHQQKRSSATRVVSDLWTAARQRALSGSNGS